MSPTSVVLEYLLRATKPLDPYSAYLTPDQLNEVLLADRGEISWAWGSSLKAQEGALLIVRVISNSPAPTGGILAGDRILAVNGPIDGGS